MNLIKLAGIVTAGLLSFSVTAEEMRIDVRNIGADIAVKEVCLNGYVYVVTYSGYGAGVERGVSIVQSYKPARVGANPPQPRTCRIKK